MRHFQLHLGKIKTFWLFINDNILHALLLKWLQFYSAYISCYYEIMEFEKISIIKGSSSGHQNHAGLSDIMYQVLPTLFVQSPVWYLTL